MADSDVEKILDKNLNDVQLDDFDIPEAVEDETDSKEYSTNIWVRGLDVNTQVADIKELFSQYGNVLSVKIISTGNPDSKVIALVTMSNNQETSLCITNLHNVLFKDINLSLSLGEKSVVSTTNINSNQTTEKSVPPKSVSKDSDSKPVNSYISRAFAKKLSSDYHKKRTYYITKKFVHDRKFSHPIKFKTHHRELNKPIFKDEAETTNINSFERALNSLHFQGNNILRNEKHSDERFSPQTSSMHRHASSSPFVVSTRKRMRNNDHHDYQYSKEAKFQQPFNKTQLYGVNHTDEISFNTTRHSQQLSQSFKFLPGKFESSRFQRNYGVERTTLGPPPPNKYFDKPFRHNFKENFEDHSRPWNNNDNDIINNNNHRLLKRRHHHNSRSSPDTSGLIKKQPSRMSGLKYLPSQNPQLAVKEERYAKFSTRASQNLFPRPPQNNSRSRLRSPKAYSSVRRSAGSQAFKIDGRRNEVVKGSKGSRLGKLDASKSRTPSPVITFDRRHHNHNDNNNNYYPLSQFSSGYKSGGNDLFQGNRSSPFIRSVNTRHYDDTAAAVRELPSSNRTSFTATTESLMPYRAYYNHENQGGSSYNHYPAADMFGKNVPKSLHDSRFVNNSGSSMQGLSSDNRYVRYIPPNSPGQDRMNALPYKRSFKPRGSGHMATNSSRYNHDPSGSYRNRPYGSIGDQTSSRRFGGSQSEVRSFFPRRGRGHVGSRYHKF